jgi:oxaloacetate decarboxylase alpha subunit
VIRLVDVSLRDGNQSLWGATGVTTRMVAGVAPLLDRIGYRAVEIATSTLMATAVRFHQEDPWERIRAARDRMPNTPLGFLTTGKRFVTFSRTPPAIFELAFELLRRNGITRLWVVDPMHDMEGAKSIATMAKRLGFTEVVGGICYSTSPVHTDEYFADRIAELDDCDAIDSVYLKDPAGLLTPDRVRTLVPKLRARLRRKPFDEIHSHCTTGLAPLTVLEAADLGMSTIHCALPPLANGNSHPAADRLVQNLRARGHDVAVDADAMADASAYLRRQAAIKNLPAGVPAEYDEAYYRHNLPGGVLSTLARQLAEQRRPELLPAVIEEAVHVRADLGWPIVVTPFAQYIVTQATLNVMSGERYAQLADEIVDLLRGDFGPLPGPVDAWLLDRAMSTKRAAQRVADNDVTIADLRARFGHEISDEDLLLRAVMPAQQVDAMVAARSSAAATLLPHVFNLLDGEAAPSSVVVESGGARISVERRLLVQAPA